MKDKRSLRIITALQLGLIAVAGIVLLRLRELQFERSDHYWRHAKARQEYTIKKIPSRGKIYDRSGRELAVTDFVPSLYVSPSKIADEIKRDLAADLARELQLEFDTVYARLTRTRGDQVLQRRVSRETMERVLLLAQVYRNSLKKKGDKKTSEPLARNAFYVLEENKRIYPHEELASHIIGYTQLDDTGDNTGVAGIEGWYNTELRGQMGVTTAPRTATGLPLEPLDPDVLASTYGHSIVLTIDRDIQLVTEQALKKRVQECSADAGVAVVYAVKTGEVLAMASVPSFSLTAIQHAHPAALRNRAITDAIEPGSVMKIFTYAAAIEEGKIPSFREIIDCAGGRWTVAGRTVVDAHSMGAVPIVAAFAQSSNVAAAKIAVMRLQPARFYKHLVDFGFGEKTGIDLPGEAPGLLRHVKDWTAQSMASLAYGYELQATAIQIAAATAAIANNGLYMKPHVAREIRNFRGEVVKIIEPELVRRVCSPQTTKRMLELMEAVVREGTGKAAALPNYRVGGKTGTTIKLDPETKRYSRGNYISSFCGIAPLDDPEICVYIWVDNPRGGTYYGGQVAAPVFKEIAAHALKVLRIPPTTGTPAESEISEPRTRLETAAATPEPTPPPDNYDPAPDTMPDLTGLTMAEATEILAQLNLEFSFTGSGVVVNQNPKPYETIDRREKIEVIFAPPAGRSVAAREEGVTDLPDEDSVSTSSQPQANPVTVTIRHGRRTVDIPTTTSTVTAGPLDTMRRPVFSPKTEETNAAPESQPVPTEEPDPRVRRGPAQDAGRSSWSKIADAKREAWTEKNEQANDHAETETANGAAGPAKPVRSAYEIPSRPIQNGGER